MAQAGRDEAGNYFLSDDGGKTWKPAPLGKDEAGQTFYHDGTDWKPLEQSPAASPAAGTEGGVASGGAPPAARAPESDPLSPARAAPSKELPTAKPPQPGDAPTAESIFGAPPKPTGFLPWDTLREYPYNLESNARAGGRMAIHGQNAVRQGKLSGTIGEMAGTAGFIGSPLSALFNPVARPVHDWVGNPAERLTGIPGTSDVVTAAVLAAPGLIPAGPRAPRMGEMPAEAAPAAPPKVSAPGTINLHPDEYSEGPLPQRPAPGPDLSGSAADMAARMAARETVAQGPRTTHMDSGGYGAHRAPAEAPIADVITRFQQGPDGQYTAAMPVNPGPPPPPGPPPVAAGTPPVPPVTPPPVAPPPVTPPGAGMAAPPAGAGGPPQQPPAGAVPPAGPPQPPATPPAPVPPGAMNAVRTSVNRLKALIDPTGIDAHSKLAESLFRENIGLAERDTANTMDALEAQQRRVNAMTPVQKYDLFRYIQNRSGGAGIADPALQPLADAMRDAAQLREQKLRALPSTSQMSFQQDYLEQLWQDPAGRVQQVYGGGRQGSGRFTKGKTVPTIDDGIAAGLTLKTDNPIEMTMNYVTNTDRFIALNAIRDTARAQRQIRYFRPGRGRPPPDWIQLHGRLGTRNTPAGPMQAWAPEGFARVWNNFVDQGFHAHPDWGHVYDVAQRANNAVQAMEFGFSLYHAFTVAMKAPVAELGRAFEMLAAGKPTETVKALADTPLASVLTPATRGRYARDIYLNRTVGTPEDRAVVDLLTRANHRFVGLDKGGEYTYSPMRSYWTSWKRGALAHEASVDAATVRAAPVLGSAKVMFRHVGRMLQTMQQPIFEKYIPLLKNGAAFNAMKAWLEANPAATQPMKLKAARDIADHMDNMMGEMVHDNIFWMRTQKQAAQLMLNSFSWTFGFGRWATGAAYDFGKIPWSRTLTKRTATAIAYPIVLGTIAAIATKLMTGEDPKDMMDLVAPRTGGMVRSGRQIVPERMMIPGSHKDFFGWLENPRQEAWNKMTRSIHLGSELATGRDWKDQPIAPQNATLPEWLTAYVKHVLGGLTPISMSQLSQGTKKGSKIPTALTGLGFREAPQYMENPRGFQQMQKHLNDKAYKAQRRFDRAHEQQYKGPSD